MYRLSARQILLMRLISGIFAAGMVAVVDRISNRFQPVDCGIHRSSAAWH